MALQIVGNKALSGTFYAGKHWCAPEQQPLKGHLAVQNHQRSCVMRPGTKRILALGLAASVLLGGLPVATTPASAHYYRHYGYYHHHHRYYGAAPFAGIAGAVIGGIAANEAARHYYRYGYPYGPYPYGGPYYGPYGYGW